MAWLSMLPSDETEEENPKRSLPCPSGGCDGHSGKDELPNEQCDTMSKDWKPTIDEALTSLSTVNHGWGRVSRPFGRWQQDVTDSEFVTKLDCLVAHSVCGDVGAQ